MIEVLALAEKEGVLSPMQVVAAFSSTPNMPLHVALQGLRRPLNETGEEVGALHRDIATLQTNVDHIIQQQSLSRMVRLHESMLEYFLFFTSQTSINSAIDGTAKTKDL